MRNQQERFFAKKTILPTAPSPEWRATTSMPRDDTGRSGGIVGSDEEGKVIMLWGRMLGGDK